MNGADGWFNITVACSENRRCGDGRHRALCWGVFPRTGYLVLIVPRRAGNCGFCRWTTFLTAASHSEQLPPGLLFPLRYLWFSPSLPATIQNTYLLSCFLFGYAARFHAHLCICRRHHTLPLHATGRQFAFAFAPPLPRQARRRAGARRLPSRPLQTLPQGTGTGAAATLRASATSARALYTIPTAAHWA